MDPRQLPDPNKAIGISEVGGQEFTIYESLEVTLRSTARQPERVILGAFNGLVPDAPVGSGLERALPIVQGQVQLDWWEAKGKEPPQRAVDNQKKRLEMGKKPVEADAGPAQKKGAKSGLKVKDVICEGLLTGKGDEAILADVHERFPDSKATKKDIGYYRHKLRQEGKLEKHVPKKTKKKPVADSSSYVPSGVAFPDKPVVPTRDAPFTAANSAQAEDRTKRTTVKRKRAGK